MARLSIIYDTHEGQTRCVAEAIADVAREQGHDATLHDDHEPPGPADLAAADLIIVGGSVHRGRHDPRLTEFVIRNRDVLQTTPSAFFSVSLSAAGRSDDQQADALRLLEDFLRDTDWTPDRTRTVAGALRYRRYGILTRYLMKWIAGRAGGDTDTSRDHEYTNWDDVRAFTLECLDLLPEP